MPAELIVELEELLGPQHINPVLKYISKLDMLGPCPDLGSIYRKGLDKKFPKTCGTCGTKYSCYDEFLKNTTPTPRGDYLVDSNRIQMHRNCHCTSTLLISLLKQRDDSYNGRQRRQLFKQCQSYLTKNLGSPESAIDKTRSIFGSIMYRGYV